jgi:hypothetical protein
MDRYEDISLIATKDYSKLCFLFLD